MRKIRICALSLGLCLALTACGSKGSTTAPKPTATPDQAQPTAAPEDMMVPAPSEAPMVNTGSLADALNPLLTYGQDTAGSSLQNVTHAAALLDWYGDSQNADPLHDYSRDLRDWYDGLDDSQRETFRANWSAVRERARQLVEEPDTLGTLVDDAGVTNDYTTIGGGYSGFLDAVDALFEGSPDMSTGAENAGRMSRSYGSGTARSTTGTGSGSVNGGYGGMGGGAIGSVNGNSAMAGNGRTGGGY